MFVAAQMTDDRPPQPGAPPPDLGDFGNRLRRAQGQNEPVGPQETGAGGVNAKGMGAAFRIATELIAALVVGAGLGLLLDRWLGTRPILLLVFLALGMASGIFSAFREAKRMGAASE
ncbi:MAG: hypothetical protein EXQ93_03940 [Alphaproteobacteria bacterium]|nr:hypothetical protein [Alphaproteobacteria bacterium]